MNYKELHAADEILRKGTALKLLAKIPRTETPVKG